MGELEGALGQFGGPFHLIVNRPPSARPGRQAGDGLQCAQHPQHDADIVYGDAADMTSEGIKQKPDCSLPQKCLSLLMLQFHFQLLISSMSWPCF